MEQPHLTEEQVRTRLAQETELEEHYETLLTQIRATRTALQTQLINHRRAKQQ